MEPASIRFKNPGAMWGRTGKRVSASKTVATNIAIPVRWGSRETVYLNDGLGQNNNIAVFNNYVDGICAQLDLWRTSPKYHARRLADALFTWSGGNETESYIAFVLKRVPNMTRNTVMDDTFLASADGIGFLKAQAWHEAGKKYPAPDGDWPVAQKRVFGNTSVVGLPLTEPAPALPLLTISMEGDSVGLLQLAMGAPITKIFDKTLEDSVKTFQSLRGLHSDGIVGPQTWGSIVGKAVTS